MKTRDELARDEPFTDILAALTPYAVTARYPEFAEPGMEEATAARRTVA